MLKVHKTPISNQNLTKADDDLNLLSVLPVHKALKALISSATLSNLCRNLPEAEIPLTGSVPCVWCHAHWYE